MVSNTFPQNNQIEEKLNTKNSNKIPSKSELKLTIKDVSNLAILKYGGVNSFGRALGVGQGMASMLLSGDYIPVKPETIHKIADCLNIDPVTLAQIYSELKTKKEIAGALTPESLSPIKFPAFENSDGNKSRNSEDVVESRSNCGGTKSFSSKSDTLGMSITDRERTSTKEVLVSDNKIKGECNGKYS